MTNLALSVATEADDVDLRALLRDNPLPGSISLSFEREPSYSRGAGVEGIASQTIIARDVRTRKSVGMGARVIQRLYINGRAQEVGYMGHLRVNHREEWGLSLARHFARSFAKFRELHADRRVSFYLASIVEENVAARRLLTAGLPGMPRAHEYARLHTYAVVPRRPRGVLPPRGTTVQRGTAELAPDIIACLQRNGSRGQFYPYWSESDLFTPARTPNLLPGDFFVAVKNSRVIGCLALWDQSSFKQTVVRGYSGNPARWRWLVNRLARITGGYHLPDVGSQVRHCYASHLAIDVDDRPVFAALLRAVRDEASRRGFDYVLIGLSESNPLRPVVGSWYPFIRYPSRLYLMAWEDGFEALARVDERTPAPEIALL